MSETGLQNFDIKIFILELFLMPAVYFIKINTDTEREEDVRLSLKIFSDVDDFSEASTSFTCFLLL